MVKLEVPLDKIASNPEPMASGARTIREKNLGARPNPRSWVPWRDRILPCPARLPAAEDKSFLLEFPTLNFECSTPPNSHRQEKTSKILSGSHFASKTSANRKNGRTCDTRSLQYDLTSKLVSHLDRHLIYPLLQFSAEQLEYDAADGESAPAKARAITQQKFELLQKTNMIDYVIDLYCDIEGLDEPPAEFSEKRRRS